jgi:hypothetical protein
MLDVTRQLYNAALQERKDAFRMRGFQVTFKIRAPALAQCPKMSVKTQERVGFNRHATTGGLRRSRKRDGST